MNRRGLTLVEVMTSAAIFLGLSALVVVILRLGYHSEFKGQGHSDAQRAVLVTLEKVRAELRGAVVLNARSSDALSEAELTYLYIPRDPQEVVIDFTGHPTYQGPASLRLEGNLLTRFEETGPAAEDLKVQPLGDLGEEAEVDFQLHSTRILEVTLQASRPDPTDSTRPILYRQSMQIYLENQP